MTHLTTETGPAGPPRETGRTHAWLTRNRTSPRIAFLLRLVVMVLSAGLSLIWSRALVRTMGGELYGMFLTFLAVAQLGGLGDLGLGAAVGIRTLQHLARGEVSAAQAFLAQARGASVFLAGLFMAAFAIASPSLPAAFRFVETSGTGSLTWLFTLGGVGIAVAIIAGYFHSLNYALGNVVWPIFPGFLLSQVASAGQLFLAYWQAPLWALYLMQVGAGAVILVMTAAMIWVSHPELAKIRPVNFDLRSMSSIGRTSFWAYLCTLGSLVYLTTDRLVINAGFGAAAVPPYQFNFRLCELAVAFLTAASYVSLPAIAVRLLSDQSEQREHGIRGVLRLQKLQVFFSCAAGAMYLALNDAFIKGWFGAEFHVPLALQIAFAFNLAVTIAGDVGVQLLGRLDESGLRSAGMTIGAAGALNLALSLLAVKSGAILGIAVATVIAQSLQTVVMGAATCRRLRLPWRSWAGRTWLLPMFAMALVAGARVVVPPIGVGASAAHFLVVGTVLLGLAWTLDLRANVFVDEWQRLRGSFR